MLNPNTEGNNFCTTSGLLTGTGAETVYDTTVAIQFCINGVAQTAKAAVTDGATPTTDGADGLAFDAVLPNKACVFVWTLNSSGTVQLWQGPIVDLDDTGALKNAAQFPALPDTVTPFAYTLYKAGSTASAAGSRPGTANWNATGITATHRNLFVLPGRPVAA
jgi:hypothetical protein